MYSYWEEKNWFSNYDYIIIGAGIVGINTAINIKQRYPGKTVAILERGALPSGASTKNAGFACFGTIGEILDDLEHQSEQEVVDTIKMRYEGLELLKKRVTKRAMEMESLGGYEVFLDKNEFTKHFEQLDFVNQIIEQAIGVKDVIKTFNQSFSSGLYKKCFYNSLEGQLNPVLLIKDLIHQANQLGVVLHFNCGLAKYEKDDYFKLTLMNGLEVIAENLIICSNAFLSDIHPGYDVIPARNQVLVTKPLKDLKIKGTFHFDKGYVYFRNINNRLLIGGARNIDLKTEETTDFGPNQKVIDYLRFFAESHLGIKIDNDAINWSGIIATGVSKKPIIEKTKEGSIIAARLGGMGVAIGSLVAKEAVQLLD